MNLNTLHKLEGDHEMGLNNIRRVGLRATAPLFVDGYKRNRNTGSLILIDEFTNDTIATGMILEAGAVPHPAEVRVTMAGL